MLPPGIVPPPTYGMLNGTNAVYYLTDCTVAAANTGLITGVANIVGSVYAQNTPYLREVSAMIFWARSFHKATI